jgi:hypothetical protein
MRSRIFSDADRATLFRTLREMMRNVYRVAQEAAPILDWLQMLTTAL